MVIKTYWAFYLDSITGHYIFSAYIDCIFGHQTLESLQYIQHLRYHSTLDTISGPKNLRSFLFRSYFWAPWSFCLYILGIFGASNHRELSIYTAFSQFDIRFGHQNLLIFLPKQHYWPLWPFCLYRLHFRHQTLESFQYWLQHLGYQSLFSWTTKSTDHSA